MCKLANNIKEHVKHTISYFADMSLIKKMTIAYVFAILLPTVIVGMYTYNQSTRYIESEMAQSTRSRLIQIKDEISRKILLAEDISNNIVFDSKIQDLLLYGLDYAPEKLNDYIDTVSNPINYALNFNGANIYQINVYFHNDVIPEYGHFLKEKCIENQDWFRKFLASGNNEMYFYPAQSDKINYGSISDSATVFRMIKKIESIDKKYLGVVVIDMRADDIFAPIMSKDSDYETYVIDMRGNIIYPLDYENPSQYSQEFTMLINDGKDHLVKNNMMYSYVSFAPISSIKIANVMPISDIIKNSSLPSRYSILVALIGVILLEIFTYYMFNRIFARLGQITRIMGIVASGNFDVRIPTNRRDEIGQLASDFNILIDKINDLMDDIIKKETSQKDAQLIALQYQINPHFIYNTIDTFRMRLELDGNYEMADAIAYFGKMLRYNMSTDSKYVSLRDEVEYIREYVTLQKIRYGDKIHFEANIPNRLANSKILRFILQPIIENSIKHGMKDNNPLEILLSVEVEQNDLKLMIHDNGTGIPPEYLNILNEHFSNSWPFYNKAAEKNIGLYNINERLKIFYGNRYAIKLESVQNKYTNVILKLPYIID